MGPSAEKKGRGGVGFKTAGERTLLPPSHLRDGVRGISFLRRLGMDDRELVVYRAQETVEQMERRLRQLGMVAQMEALMALRDALKAERVYMNRWGEEVRQADWLARVKAAESLYRLLSSGGSGIPKEVIEVILHRGEE
jgi:hypothetical protein